MEDEIKNLYNYFVTQSDCKKQSTMKILLADHFGMCFGVRDAIAQAEQLATEQPLTILGELVHNPIVRERLRAQGIEEAALDSTRPASRRVMITAHGASDKKRAEWRTAARCARVAPMVKIQASKFRPSEGSYPSGTILNSEYSPV